MCNDLRLLPSLVRKLESFKHRFPQVKCLSSHVTLQCQNTEGTVGHFVSITFQTMKIITVPVICDEIHSFGRISRLTVIPEHFHHIIVFIGGVE